MKRRRSRAIAVTVFPWPLLFPELQDEIRTRCDWRSKLRLGNTCHSEYVADAGSFIPAGFGAIMYPGAAHLLTTRARPSAVLRSRQTTVARELRPMARQLLPVLLDLGWITEKDIVWDAFDLSRGIGLPTFMWERTVSNARILCTYRKDDDKQWLLVIASSDGVLRSTFVTSTLAALHTLPADSIFTSIMRGKIGRGNNE